MPGFIVFLVATKSTQTYTTGAVLICSNDKCEMQEISEYEDTFLVEHQSKCPDKHPDFWLKEKLDLIFLTHLFNG